MSNIRSIAGGMAWAAIACLMMLVALEPVTLEAPAYVPAYAAMPSAPTAA